MPATSKLTSLSSDIVLQLTDADGYSDDESPIQNQIEALKKQLIAYQSPGGKLIIKKMSAIDNALSQLYEDLEEFKPQKHHKSYAADFLVRRYIYIKSQFNLDFFDYVKQEIENRIKDFHLTPDNTRLPLELELVAPLKAWQHRYRQDKARESRGEQTVRGRIVACKATTSVSSPTFTKPARRVRTNSGT